MFEYMNEYITVKLEIKSTSYSYILWFAVIQWSSMKNGAQYNKDQTSRSMILGFGFKIMLWVP